MSRDHAFFGMNSSPVNQERFPKRMGRHTGSRPGQPSSLFSRRLRKGGQSLLSLVIELIGIPIAAAYVIAAAIFVVFAWKERHRH